MQAARIIIAAMTASLLSACASIQGTTTAIMQIDKGKIALPQVDRVNMRDVNWMVISKTAKPGGEGSPDEAFKRAHSDSVFAVSPKDYEAASINTANMLRAIKQLQAQVKALNDYYQPEDPKPEDGKKDATKATP